MRIFYFISILIPQIAKFFNDDTTLPLFEVVKIFAILFDAYSVQRGKHDSREFIFCSVQFRSVFCFR